MGEERVERYAERFTAIDDTECVVSDYEEGRCVALETACEDREYGEENTAYDLEGDFKDSVGHEEGFDVVDSVGVVAVENIALERVDGDVVEHYLVC